MKRAAQTRPSTVSIGLTLLLAMATLGAAAAPPYLGRTVADVLDEFAAEGVSFVFSSNLVSGRLRVLTEPQSDDPVAVAREILAAHNLTLSATGDFFLVVRSAEAPPGGTLRVVLAHSGPGLLSTAMKVVLTGPSPRSVSSVDPELDFIDLIPGRYELSAESVLYRSESIAVELEANETARILLRLEPVVPPLEELTVGASRYDIVGDFQHSNAYFNRADVEHLSNLGGDPVRTVHRLPGTAAGGISAKSYVRGGDDDEMIFMLDGLRLIDPFHARDFQSIFSTIDHRAISSVQVYSGGFPAKYGDSLSGVMLIEPRAVDAKRHHELGLSTLSASGLTSGTFNEGKGEWLASIRRTTLDLLLDRDRGRPRFGNVYGHVGIQLGERGKLSVNGLVSEDDILIIAEDDPEEEEQARSNTENGQFWLKLETQGIGTLRSETLLSSARFTNSRRGVENDPTELVGFVDDARTLKVDGLKQEWTWLPSDRHLMNWGFEAKRLSAAYRYSSSVDLFGFLASFEGAVPSVRRNITTFPKSSTYSLHFSDRVSFGSSMIAEVGFRWDKQTNLPTEEKENQISPRLSFLYRFGPNTDLRASWGHYFQSQGLLQLQVEDGLNEFFPAQSSRHFILSLEHRMANDLLFRFEAYKKTMSSLRPRYENLFDRFSLMPELQPDRVRIAPGRAASSGIEWVIAKDTLRPLNWWASYTLSSVKDSDSGRNVPRSWDQRHALAGGITWTREKWTLSTAAHYHTGWPFTELFLMAANDHDGKMVAVPGERNAERLGSYSRLDFRAERSLDMASGQFKVFVEATNLLDRKNPCCVEYDLDETPDGAPFLERDVGRWMPRIVSAGVLWEF